MNNNITNKLSQTREMVDKITQLKIDLEQLWQPVIENLDNMSEKEITEILANTNYYQAGFHVTVREFYRGKFA